MAEADPDNDMAHFSLGNALLQSGQYAEAAASLQRCQVHIAAASRRFLDRNLKARQRCMRVSDGNLWFV